MEKIIYKDIDEYVYYEKLDNGLEIYLKPNNKSKNFYMTFTTKFGSLTTKFKSVNDKKWTVVPNGTAHFLEHQMFEEEGENAFLKFAKLGSSINAYTSYNNTTYEVISSNYFKENLNLLLDYVQNPVFKDSSINKEKNIIASEISMYENMPDSKLNFGLEYILNKNDNHKYMISGNKKDIEKINSNILYKTYNTFYNPSNMFIVITGKFNYLEALAIIKENQTKKKFNNVKYVVKHNKEPISVSKTYETYKMNVNIPSIKIGFKLDKKIYKDYTDKELRIYFDMLISSKFGSTSDICEKLTTSNLIESNLNYNTDIRNNYILITFDFKTNYKKEVTELLLETLNNLKINSDELKRIKRVNIANLIMHFDNIISLNEDLTTDIIYYDKIDNNIIDLYREVTIKELNKIAGLINSDNMCMYEIN